ncbi:MAG: sacC [Verrucomicrobiales bacterium]|nr:sacC [Verrucomicrobiales bacterium]
MTVDGFQGGGFVNSYSGGDDSKGRLTSPGGSERLQPAQWDASEFLGREVSLEIVDDASGGWGHINIDQIVQSDNRSSVRLSSRTSIETSSLISHISISR